MAPCTPVADSLDDETKKQPWLKRQFKSRRFWRNFLPPVIVPFLLTSIFTYAIVDGNSMNPSLKTGDVVVARRWLGARVNDIVLAVLTEPDGSRRTQVKRVKVVGPGFYSKEEKFVPEGYVCLVGDGFNSMDPGLVPLRDLRGVVVAIFPARTEKLSSEDRETTTQSNREVGPALQPPSQSPITVAVAGKQHKALRVDDNSGGDGVIVLMYDMSRLYGVSAQLYCPQTATIYSVKGLTVKRATELNPCGSTTLFVEPPFNSPTLGTKVYLLGD